MKSLAIGAVLWDVINNKEYIGGAPFNLTAHLAQLGWDAAILSCVGRDARGCLAKKEIQALGVNSHFIYEHASLPTGIATVTLNDQGVPSYELPYSAYDEIPWTTESIDEINRFQPDVLCVGTHEQRSAHNRELWNVVCDHVKAKYVYYDVNLRLGFEKKDIIERMISRSNILKLNDVEVERLSNMLWGCTELPDEFCKRIVKDYSLFCVVVTLGSEGCLIWYQGTITRIPGYPTSVVSTVGCGDAFSAGFLTSLCQTGNPVASAVKGNILGAYVATKEQTIPRYTEDILSRVKEA